VRRLLTGEQEDLLRHVRDLVGDLSVHLARVGASDEDLELLKQSLRQLEELFLLVIVGEFNAGKTAVLNALFGDRLLPEGVTPTTTAIHLLRYGEALRQVPAGDDYATIEVPVEWLRNVNLVDTPGTNAVIQRHQEITEHFVPRSDLVLFITSADRPFSESERLFLERVRQWGKKIVIIINKIDLIDAPDDRQKIQDFVREHGRALLGVEPQVFPVSARLALQAKQAARARPARSPGGPLWEASAFEPLEDFIVTHLDARARLRLKLENPLGIAATVIQKYTQVIAGRQELLRGDVQTLDAIDEQVAAYEVDMRRDFRYQLSHVDNVLYEMAERGDRFLDEMLRLGRIFDLINGEKLRGQFEREVVADTSRQIERHVGELIDWMVDKDYRQWRAVTEYLTRRAAQHTDRIVGQVRDDFELNRQNLLASVGRDAQRVVDGYDREAESFKLAQEVQRAILQTAAVEAGALGLGALLVALLHSTLLDVSGILGAGALAALGLYVLPHRRSRLKTQLRGRVTQLRDQLNDTLTRRFEVELRDSGQRLREGIAPYTRFVRVEREKLDRLSTDLQETRRRAEVIRAEIDTDA
jgi:small GTP-binding protein